MLIRLQKYLADKGVASRRKCEEYIKKGYVKVNGKVVTEMGIKIDSEHDHVETTAQLTLKEEPKIYYAFHKPAGYVCSVTGPEKPKIMELLGSIKERIFPVGRLDKLTSGLLLLTNDGRFAYELTHPKFEKEKEYLVIVREKVTPVVLTKLAEPFYIHGKKTRDAEIILQGPHRFSVILKEGRNRQIRRMCEKVGVTIERLKRIRIGKLVLGELPPKEYRELTASEISSLRQVKADAA